MYANYEKYFNQTISHLADKSGGYHKASLPQLSQQVYPTTEARIPNKYFGGITTFNKEVLRPWLSISWVSTSLWSICKYQSQADPICASVVHDGLRPNKNFLPRWIKVVNGYWSSNRSGSYQQQKFENASIVCRTYPWPIWDASKPNSIILTSIRYTRWYYQTVPFVVLNREIDSDRWRFTRIR